jgi:hypothetical protein
MTLPIAFLGAAMAAFVPQAQDDAAARPKAWQAVFDGLEKALKEKDEASFKARWQPDGFERNLVGGSGLTGQAVFGQGSRKKWFPKPDLAQAKVLGDGEAAIVPCGIWAWEKEKAVDKVAFLLVRGKDGWLVLGGGEKRALVEALASRWLKKEPLDPPKE